jgi:heme/copper-type cytochrome/quinol oxidase subunit 2
MDGKFDPLGALFLLAWLVAGTYAVRAFAEQQPRPLWQWALFLVGGIVIFLASFYLYAMWALRRSTFEVSDDESSDELGR